MKYINMNKIIVGIGILLVIFGPIYCGQSYWKYKISQERKDFNAGVQDYTNYYMTGKRDDELIRQQEQIEANVQKAKIIAFCCAAGSIVFGVLLIKKSNKIVEKFLLKK